jgi:hypothetical protein
MGEDRSDAAALAELLKALCPGAVVKALRHPMRLRRTRDSVSIMDKVLPTLRAELTARAYDCVFVHSDCDDVEPADETMEQSIAAQFRGQVTTEVHAVVPAWELEAWWFLWPDACLHVCRSWRRPDRYTGREVGRVTHAKEELRRALRRPGHHPGNRQYGESDAPRIASAVRELGLVSRPQATSASFERFARAALVCCRRNEAR